MSWLWHTSRQVSQSGDIWLFSMQGVWHLFFGRSLEIMCLRPSTRDKKEGINFNTMTQMQYPRARQKTWLKLPSLRKQSQRNFGHKLAHVVNPPVDQNTQSQYWRWRLWPDPIIRYYHCLELQRSKCNALLFLPHKHMQHIENPSLVVPQNRCCKIQES